MKLLVRFTATALLLLMTSQRLPAPVHELDEKVTPVPQESAKSKVKHSESKGEGESEKTKSEAKSIPRPSGKARNLDGPKPIYPSEAAGLHLSGTGKVIDVTVSQSAGSPILDNAAVVAFRQWHEDPQCAKEVTMTMTFGAAPAVPEE